MINYISFVFWIIMFDNVVWSDHHHREWCLIWWFIIEMKWLKTHEITCNMIWIEWNNITYEMNVLYRYDIHNVVDNDNHIFVYA